ncbi:MAG: Flp pilus assembly protein CpaB [Pseudomonadota bacterium]
MSPFRILILLIAAGAAMGVAFLVRSATSAPAVATSTEVQVETVTEAVEVSEVEVLVAARDLRIGEVMTPEDLRWALWPENELNPNFFVKDSSTDKIEDVSGMVVRQYIYEREPLVAQRIVERGDTSVLAALVSPGMRAVSMEISTETASGGFILPEDRVDVILTYETERFTREGVVEEIESVVIIENARVLAIDQGLRTDDETATLVGSTATLELSPDDAALIAYGEREGQMSLVLRSMFDAVQAGDTVVSRASEFAAGRETSSVTVFRNGRIREAGGTRGGE